MSFLAFVLPPALRTEDALVAACWLGANALLAAAAWKWVRALFPRDPFVETLAHVLVLCWGSLLVVAFALSLVGALTGPLLLGAVQALALLALLWRRPVPLPGSEPAPPGPAEKAWLCGWGALLALGLGHVVTGGLLTFPHDWDSLAYHIPLIDQWLQARSLYAPDGARWSSPGNNEVLGLWMVGAFSGDFLIYLNNLPATLLLAAAAVGLGTRLGLSRGLAHLGALAVVCNFVVLNQLVNAENDVAVAACFFAAAFYALRATEGEGGANTVLAAVSVGLLAGIKYYAFGYAALAGLCWVLLTLAARGRRAALAVVVAGAAGALVFGGYWYARNFVATGSPLYPREFFKHPDTLTLIYPDVAHTSFLGNNRPELLGLYVESVWKMTGPCQLAGVVLAPLALVWLAASGLWLAFRAGRPREGRARLALGLWLAGSGLLLAITPFAVEDDPGTLNQMLWHYCPVRYGMCSLSTATLAALLLLQDGFSGTRRWCRPHPGAEVRAWHRLIRALLLLPPLLFAGAALFQVAWAARRVEIHAADSLLIAGNVVFAAAAVLLVGALWPRVRPWLGAGLGAAALVAGAWACGALAERWHRGFAAHYDRMLGGGVFRTLAEERPGAGKMCALYHRCYPFFGSRRQYRVCQPVYVYSAEWLAEYFRQQEVVLIGGQLRAPGAVRFGWFDECLALHPQAFARISDTPGLVLFHVEPGRLAGRAR